MCIRDAAKLVEHRFPRFSSRRFLCSPVRRQWKSVRFSIAANDKPLLTAREDQSGESFIHFRVSEVKHQSADVKVIVVKSELH
jgi:hypothetical protein